MSLTAFHAPSSRVHDEGTVDCPQISGSAESLADAQVDKACTHYA
jgi:hypothetical protein